MRAIAMLVATLLMLATAARAAELQVQVGVGHNVQALLIAPDTAGPHPGILVLETSRGLSGSDVDFARALAAQGYVCLVPSYLEAYGLTGNLRFEGFTTFAEKLYADLANAVDYLAASPQVAGARVGAVGFSNGGYFATWLAARHKVAAAVSYYGALSGAGTDRELTRFQPDLSPASTPVLLLVGTEDSYRRATHRYVSMLRAAGAPGRAVFYDGADHEFDRIQGEANGRARQQAWNTTLGFFHRWLRGGAPGNGAGAGASD